MFIDLSKAFDLVDHRILLQKLDRMGIRGTANQWVCSYLSNRNQKVVTSTVNGLGISEYKHVNLSVPQGSILGPLFYILYVNDFPSNFEDCHTTGYADDTTLLVSCKLGTFKELIVKNILSRCKAWLNSHKLVMNNSKPR
jgi:hypothetical protein